VQGAEERLHVLLEALTGEAGELALDFGDAAAELVL
jgi:hypothetical protein